MESFGYPLQYSVFVCDLDNVERYEMLGRIGEIINHDVDSVAIMDVGDVDRRGQECFEFMGAHRALPQRGPQIV
jgi:CRISPR-associated protein Cas2